MRKSIYMLSLIFLTITLSAQENAQDQTPKSTDKKETEQTVTETPNEKDVKQKEKETEKQCNHDAIYDDIDYLEDRIDEVEKEDLMDKINFDLDFRTTLNNFVYKDKSKAYNGKTAEEMVENYGLLSEDGDTPFDTNFRLRLIMRASVSKRLKFTGWLKVLKAFNSTTAGQYEGQSDLTKGYLPDYKLYLERAYIDYFLYDWIAITFGRLPTTDGFPYDIRNNHVRLGTFTEPAFNVPFDGVFVSLLLDKWGIPKGYLRLLAAGSMNRDYTGERNLIVSDYDQYSWYFGALYNQSIPSINGTFSLNTLFSPHMGPAIMNYENESITYYQGSVATMLLSNAILGFQNIFESGFSFWISYTNSLVIPPDRTKSEDGIGFGKETEDDEEWYPIIAIYGRIDGKPQIGHMIYTGLQYATPLWLPGGAFAIGADYNYGTKKFFGQYVPDTTGINRFETRGHYIDSYFIIPFHSKAQIKLGYIFVKSEYPYGMPLGVIKLDPEKAQPKIDEQIHNFYMMVNVYF